MCGLWRGAAPSLLATRPEGLYFGIWKRVLKTKGLGKSGTSLPKELARVLLMAGSKILLFSTGGERPGAVYSPRGIIKEWGKLVCCFGFVNSVSSSLIALLGIVGDGALSLGCFKR